MSAPVGIYVRVSRKGDREDERFHSPREQAERAAALARAKGYAVGPTYQDIDVSGATALAKRPAMAELLAAVEAGDLAGIAAYSLDRLSREPAHGDALVRRVTKAGGVLLTPDIPDAIDSPTGEFTFGMLLQVAKLYRSQAGARFATAKERSIKAGVQVGPTPVGYRAGADRRLEIDPDTAPMVRELFERWVAGEGRNKLARLLDEATSRTWSRNAVPKIIRNPVYMTGRLQYGDITSGHAAGGIVDAPLWHAAQKARPGARPQRNPESSWLLTGTAVCGSCDYMLTPTTTRAGGPKQYRYYRCTNRKCDAKRGASAPRLENYVRDSCFRLIGHTLRERASGPDLAPLEDALAVAERRLEQVLAPEARDALGDLWAADVKARRLERDTAAAALGEARQHDPTPERVRHLRDEWDGMTPVERREALGHYLVERVFVHGNAPAAWEVMFR